MTKPKGKKEKPDKYIRILEAAIKVFAEQGFFNSTVAQIAKEAGVADGTIYLYFKSKDDILAQFFSYKTKLIFDRFIEEVNKAENAGDKLRNLIRRHFEEFQNDPDTAVVFQTERHQFHTSDIKMKDMIKMYLNIIADIIEQGQEEGSVRKDLYVGLVKRYIMGAVDEVINTWVNSGRQYDLVSMADPLVDLYLKGIGAND